MIRHILFPSDGSDAARKAVSYLIPFAQQFQAEITLLHTYDFTMGHVMSRYGNDSATVHELETRIGDYGSQMLDELRQQLEAQGLRVRKQFNEKGDAGHWIVKLAESESCDLIMMGTRGMGVLKSVLLGSTSHYVVNHCRHTPVYLIPVEE